MSTPANDPIQTLLQNETDPDRLLGALKVIKAFEAMATKPNPETDEEIEVEALQTKTWESGAYNRAQDLLHYLGEVEKGNVTKEEIACHLENAQDEIEALLEIVKTLRDGL